MRFCLAETYLSETLMELQCNPNHLEIKYNLTYFVEFSTRSFTITEYVECPGHDAPRRGNGEKMGEGRNNGRRMA